MVTIGRGAPRLRLNLEGPTYFFRFQNVNQRNGSLKRSRGPGLHMASVLRMDSKMFLIILFWTLAHLDWIVSSARADASPFSTQTLVLGVSEQRTLFIPELDRFSIRQNRKRPIVRAIGRHPLPPNQILLEGLRSGHADLWVWKKDGSSELRSLHVRATRTHPTPSLSGLSLDENSVIRLRVTLLELQRSGFQRLGVDWPSSVTASFETSRLNPALPIEWTLHAIESEGKGKILSRPEITLRVPGEAELFSGGEIPLPVRSRNQAGVQWRKVGLGLKLRVTELLTPKVRLEVESESSQLAAEFSLADVPGISSNRLTTQIDAFLDQPLLLSGLLQTRDTTQNRGIPGIFSLPFLSWIFGSQHDRSQHTELVILLHPLSPKSTSSTEWIPRGPVPPPRNWIAPEEIARLTLHPDYPWNVFQRHSRSKKTKAHSTPGTGGAP